MSDYKTHDEPLYDFTAGPYCGVLMTRDVMKRHAKLHSEYITAVRQLLLEAAQEGGKVFPSMWTLHYPNDKQVYVAYIDTSRDVASAIKAATDAGRNPVVRKELVFVAGSVTEAAKMADARANEFALDSEEPKA